MSKETQSNILSVRAIISGFVFFSLLVFFSCQPSFALRFCSPDEVKSLDIDQKPSQLRANLKPILQSLSSDQVLVQFFRKKPATFSITVKETKSKEKITRTIKKKSAYHQIGLCGLKPDTQYQYTVDKKHYVFQTLPKKIDSSYKLAVVGDYGWKGKHTKDIARRIEKYDPRIIITTGDNAYSKGKFKEFKKYVLKPYQNLLSTTAFYPALGNHDVDTDRGKPYLDIFSLPHNNPNKSERYYSFDAGPVHYVILDSATYQSLRTKNSEQIAWLKQNLKKNTLPWTIVSFHHSPYCHGTLHKSDWGIQKALVPVLSEYKVDLVVTGHSHIYERTHPVDGVTYVVTGGGGRSTRGVKKIPKTTAIAVGKKYHFLGIRVSEKSLFLEAITDKGDFIDQWEIKKPNKAKKNASKQSISQ